MKSTSLVACSTVWTTALRSGTIRNGTNGKTALWRFMNPICEATTPEVGIPPAPPIEFI